MRIQHTVLTRAHSPPSPPSPPFPPSLPAHPLSLSLPHPSSQPARHIDCLRCLHSLHGSSLQHSEHKF
eukprot:441345-Hanusia_phi.AAC.2